MPEVPSIPQDVHTVGSALRAFAAELARAGIEEPAGDARRLMADTLGLSGAAILASPERPLSARELELLVHRMARRAAREPVSRILGERHFYGRSFAISPAVLDPRSDTETLVSVALDVVRAEGWAKEPIRLLDIGTGSGCLLTTLLCELPQARGTGTDISPAALELARLNATQLGVEDRATWLVADTLENVPAPCHLLVTNPPYIPTPDIAGLDPEVRDHDPLLALDGGADGLEFYRRMAPRLPRVVPAGWFLCEVGYGQANAVADLLATNHRGAEEPEIRIHHDLDGRKRCVAMKTRG
jgi:release factor glutamine methyltransferase